MQRQTRIVWLGSLVLTLCASGLLLAQSGLTLTWSINKMPVVYGPVVITKESRFWQVDELRGKRVIGNVVIERGASNYILRDVKIEHGCLVIKGNNWHGTFENIWIQHSPCDGGVMANDVWREDGYPLSYHGLTFRQVLVSHGSGFGWILRSQTALLMQTCAADQNAQGGFLMNGVHAILQSCSAESNGGNALRLFDSTGIVQNFVHNNALTHRVVIDGGSQVSVVGTLALPH